MSNVLARYRELLRLLRRLPSDKQGGALIEARATLRARSIEADPQKALDYQRELVSRIGFLRATTPKQPGEVTASSGVYVYRDGKLVKGLGEGKGSRVADGGISNEEAHRRNAKDFKRLYGADKPKSMFF